MKDSWDFHAFIKNRAIPKNHVLMSLDVVSLFTSIPTSLAMLSIEKYWEKISSFTCVPKHEFMRVVALVLECSYFVFDGKFYSQINGIAMGNPLSAQIAELVMENLETTVMNNNDLRLGFYKRFVDDIIVSCEYDNVNNVINAFNDFHAEIRFTHELELDSRLNFLDIGLVRCANNDKILTSWYCKPTWIGRYVNALSEAPYKLKVNSINVLIDRALTFSNIIYRDQNLEKIRTALEKNMYKRSAINKLIKKRIYYHYNKDKYKKIKIQNNQYNKIAYIKGITNQICKTLNNYGIKQNFALKAPNNLNQLFTKHKFKHKQEERSGIVYELNCKSCNSLYIGQTKNKLITRIKQHLNSIKNKTSCTALAEHHLKTGHTFDFASPKILCYEKNTKKRQFLEMVHIKNKNDSINYRSDVQNLSNLYTNLIKKSLN